MSNSRRYWLTVHWPPFQGCEDDENPYVWLQAIYWHAAVGMQQGDYVAVYEYRHGPNELNEDGTILHHGAHNGHQAVIWYGEVAKPPPVDVGEDRIFEGHGVMNWVCFAELSILDYGGVGREELNQILGYRAGHVFFGFGCPPGSGLREVTDEQFTQMTQPA